MSYLDAVTRERVAVPRRTVIYGAHGVGKTTWASKWPNPLLIPTEDGFHDIDVPHGPQVKSLAGLKRAITDVAASDFDTIILDSIDWAERFVIEELDASSFDQSWGKGAVEIGHRVFSILSLLSECRDAGKHVVVIGHQHVAKVIRTDGKEYGTHTLNLTKHASRLVCEWADEVLYAEADVLVKSSDSKFGGIAVDKGSRSLYTSGSTLFDAKNRSAGMPSRFELSDVSGYLSFVLGE